MSKILEQQIRDVEKEMDKEDIEYLISRLERVIELINAGEGHMAVAKLLADIAALKVMVNEEKI